MNSPRKRRQRRGGTGLAISLAGTVLAALLAVSMGCVVTNKISLHEEPNSPPCITQPAGLGQDEPSFESIYFIDLDNTQFSMLTLRALVRDADVYQTLQWKLFLDFDPLDPTPNPNIAGDDMTGDGTAVRTDLVDAPIAVQVSQLGGPGCHKLELRVSSSFVAAFPNYEPRDPEDLAVMVFWVAVVNQANPTVDMATCL